MVWIPANENPNSGDSHKQSPALDWIRKPYWLSRVIPIVIETRDYKWSNIAALFQVLLVLVNSKPIIDGVNHDKLSGTFPFSDHVMIMGNKGIFTPPYQTDILSAFYLIPLLERWVLHVEMFRVYVLSV